ncbi:putative nuclease HARBI1 [Cucumis melo var. makuwa]|uniref:Putative nuclease HARBI1 n=1 Tax=Cucumis melo var. makuwa TaxID=1194695 RepID=A0A5D3D2G7_CUCMM|nr:putative nuclease HARBI1 [Cucumis melo var. makuwa]
MVAIFLHIVAHDVKNKVARRHFASDPFMFARAVAMVLGALDGTHIKVNFIFVMPKWKGSASGSRVLRDAVSRVSRPTCLKVLKGYYYLCDVGYLNVEGFLAPYRGQRYRLTEWRGGNPPKCPKELFNMRYSSIRNVIERTFRSLKGQWAILRGRSYCPVDIQCKIITACCLLHNLKHREMGSEAIFEEPHLGKGDSSEMNIENINFGKTTNVWTEWRDNLANQMFEDWNNV